MKYVKFDSIDDFNAKLTEINTEKGFPDTTGTLSYSYPVSGLDGKIYAAILDSDLHYLSEIVDPPEVVDVSDVPWPKHESDI